MNFLKIFFLITGTSLLFDLNGQKIDDYIIYSVYFDGVIASELLKDEKVKQLTVQEGKEKTIYSVSRTDSTSVILVASKEKTSITEHYECTFDLELNLQRYVQYENSGSLDYIAQVQNYARQEVDDELHEFKYSHTVMKDGSINYQDTLITIKRLRYASGHPTHVKEKYLSGGKVTEKEKFFLYEFDDQGRLTELKEYNGNQDLTDLFTYEYLDEQGQVNVTINNQLTKLFFDGKLLNRTEVYGYSGLNSYRLFKYNKKGRLIKLREFDKDGALQETYKYRYN